jgi:hypothetical protein
MLDITKLLATVAPAVDNLPPDAWSHGEEFSKKSR